MSKLRASRSALAAGALVLAVTAGPSLARAQATGASTAYDVVVLSNLMVPMRDGVSLATDVYLPARDGRPLEGGLPVILERTPYNKDGVADGWPRFFVPRGYVGVVQDVRGRYRSGGRWRPLRDDGPDGADIAAWIGRQSWSNGRIGTVGTSYAGGTPHAMAIANSFDPRHPVPTIGGNVSSEGDLMLRGARDQRCRPEALACTDTLPLAARKDVLVFETPLLEQDVEASGRLVVKLWASSSAVDTDFTAKLVDVYPPSPDFPSGVALNVADSIVRGRYRESLVAEKPMTPGTPYELTIEMYPTSLVFGRGHRIRLDVSSSNFPRFDRNTNTGGTIAEEGAGDLVQAVNRVFHTVAYPSRLILPVTSR